ncbi:unnamed protein product [Brachionus calyciflorus]|uniref:Chromo domain-containing protein n=1 Tax=Brachionus calyciflorus TaxID=104777 RepID=A0A814I3M7_9BILA|nr:unnamed protein product [Brachionus calyciflorus]
MLLVDLYLVQEVIRTQSEESEDSQRKTLDPWEDEALLHFLDESEELKKLCEESQQMALVKIDEVQKEQKRIQDKRTKPLIDSLEKGTTVFIKNEGILGKLEARYSGPYSISKVTSSGNYELMDSENVKLKMSYPLHKLKVIKKPSDLKSESFEVEEIVDKRTVNNETEYLVKWKDCPDE